MAGNSVQGLEATGIVTAVGLLFGLVAWPFESNKMDVWGFLIPRVIAVFVVPAVGVIVSGLLLLFVQCDPMIPSHSPSSRASVAAAIALPSGLALVTQVIVLISALAGHTLGTKPIAFLAGLLMVGIGGIFYTIEQNYVVGIRDMWTLRSPQVWEKTHEWAYKFYGVAGLALVVLAFIVPGGFWSFLLIVGLFLLATILSVGYSYIIRDDQYSYIVR